MKHAHNILSRDALVSAPVDDPSQLSQKIYDYLSLLVIALMECFLCSYVQSLKYKSFITNYNIILFIFVNYN